MTRRGAWAAAYAAAAALAFLPGRPSMPSADLDSSWGLVLQHAWRLQWQHGTDVAFTYGPLGYLAVPIFAPDVYWLAVIARLCLGAVCGWAVHVSIRRAGWTDVSGAAALVLLLPPVMASFDLVWILPALLWPFTATAQDRTARAATGALGLVIGVAGLVKFTTLVLGLVLALAFTVDDRRRGRRPIAALALCGAVATGWLLARQHPANLPDWLAVSWTMASAYGEAMSTPVGPYQIRELVVFGLAALATLAGSWAWRRTEPGAGYVTLTLVPVLMVVFKLGFVRHDAHATSAFFAMPLLGTLAVAPALRATARRRVRALALCVVVLGMIAYAYGLRRHFDRLAPPEHYRAIIARQLQTIEALLHPGQLSEGLVRDRERALAALRREVNVADLTGTVDVYGHHQGVVVHDVAYAPRPVFQSYAAYAPALARLNRAHVESAAGPHHVLFDPETIDFRYPLHDEAASLPALLGAYEARDVRGRFLRLERRPIPRSTRLRSLGATSAHVSTDMRVPRATRVWAHVGLAPTWLGRLAALAFKLPPVAVDVRTADGDVREHRIIPSLAADGLLASPLVRSPEEMLAFMHGDPSPDTRRVVSLRIRPGWPWAYERSVEVHWFSLESGQ